MVFDGLSTRFPLLVDALLFRRHDKGWGIRPTATALVRSGRTLDGAATHFRRPPLIGIPRGRLVVLVACGGTH